METKQKQKFVSVTTVVKLTSVSKDIMSLKSHKKRKSRPSLIFLLVVDGSGHIIMDPDSRGPKSYGSGTML